MSRAGLRGIGWWAVGLGLVGSLATVEAANPFETEITAFELADALAPPPTNAVLFVGSSSIRIWTDLPAAFPSFVVLNRGFGGSEASDVLFFFDRVVKRYHPPLVVYYEGDNDLAAGKPATQIFGDWTNFVNRVEQELPGTGVVFLAVKPSPSRVAFLAPQRALNALVKDHCLQHPRRRFVDVFTPMLDDQGQPRGELFGSDQLHMNATGYALWQSLLAPVLEAWAREYPLPSIRQPAPALLLDFGDPAFATPPGPDGYWNNVLPEVTSDPNGHFEPLLSTNGAPTRLALQLVARFNALSDEGTLSSTRFPSTATRDSVCGNVEPVGGLPHVVPVFRLTGLARNSTYRFTFYASSGGAGENRQTRYTVSGATTGFADLDPVANTDDTATVDGIQPSAAGEVTVAITPGPANNHPQHLTHLGALRVDWSPTITPGLLIDFGAAGSPTTFGVADPVRSWNNLTTTLGSTSTGRLTNLISVSGAATGIGLQMVSRFNGANENGTTAHPQFPATATRDSLFGNTEVFSGLSNVKPAFKLTGLDPHRRYAMTFYASRLGVADNRQTRYTVTGTTTATTDLNPANNVEATASIAELAPNDLGELLVALTPGPANNNANHFTYLGFLALTWADAPPTPAAPTLTNLRFVAGTVRFELTGTTNVTYWIQRSPSLLEWHEVQPVTLIEPSRQIELDAAGPHQFYRVIAP